MIGSMSIRRSGCLDTGLSLKQRHSNAQVERIFVNPAIKKALCRETTGNRTWLHKVRPWWGHDYHFHVRLRCPADQCRMHAARTTTPGDGCDKDLTGGSPTRGSIPSRAGEAAHHADLPPACRPCWPNRNANEQRDPIGPLALVAFSVVQSSTYRRQGRPSARDACTLCVAATNNAAQDRIGERGCHWPRSRGAVPSPAKRT